MTSHGEILTATDSTLHYRPEERHQFFSSSFPPPSHLFLLLSNPLGTYPYRSPLLSLSFLIVFSFLSHMHHLPRREEMRLFFLSICVLYLMFPLVFVSVFLFFFHLYSWIVGFLFSFMFRVFSRAHQKDIMWYTIQEVRRGITLWVSGEQEGESEKNIRPEKHVTRLVLHFVTRLRKLFLMH